MASRLGPGRPSVSLGPWRVEDVVAPALGDEDETVGRAGPAIRARGRERGGSAGEPLGKGNGKNRHRPAGAAASQGGFVGRGRGVVVAPARPVGIHRADAVWVRALLVRGCVLEVLHERLHGCGLQAERRQQEQRQGPGPLRRERRSSRVHDNTEERLPMGLGIQLVYLSRSLLLSTGGQDHALDKKTVRMGAVDYREVRRRTGST